MLHYFMQRETHVTKICIKYFTITEHVNKNWCHAEIVAVVSYRNVRISVRKKMSGSTTLWFWLVHEGSKEQEKA